MFKLSLLILLLSSCTLNRVDKKHLKQGRWKLYYDDAKKHLMLKGRYKNGEQTGHWKYYTRSGRNYLDERYLKTNQIFTTYFDSLSRKQLQGYATYYETEDTAYYRWDGNWLKFDTTGKVIQVSYYKMGKFAWFNPIPASTKRK